MQTTRFPQRANGTVERLAGFMAHLRTNGLSVGVAETEASMRALTSISAVRQNEVRLALKAICAIDQDKFARFDDLFNAYWMNRGLERRKLQQVSRQDSNLDHVSTSLTSGSGEQSDVTGELEQPDNDSEGEASGSGEGKLVSSKTTNLEKVDLRQLMIPEDMERAIKLAEKLARSIRDRRSRRRRAAKSGALLDLRRIARNSVSSGGEPIKLFKRKKPDRPVHLVALLDVSGSMTVYARVFLAFLKGLISADQRTDAFLFHTKLVNISDALRDHDTLRAVGRLSLLADGFGGGTKIATNLAQFNAQYAAQIINGRSVVIILSDGYDTDPPEAMAAALARLKRRGCRIIWLNPLKGWKDYEPVARGMAAALPHLDLFAEANTLESLAAIEPWLQRL